MMSNTVEIESYPVNFPSFSVEKRTYKPDPFTIKDGRSVGRMSRALDRNSSVLGNSSCAIPTSHDHADLLALFLY